MYLFWNIRRKPLRTKKKHKFWIFVSVNNITGACFYSESYPIKTSRVCRIHMFCSAHHNVSCMSTFAVPFPIPSDISAFLYFWSGGFYWLHLYGYFVLLIIIYLSSGSHRHYPIVIRLYKNPGGICASLYFRSGLSSPLLWDKTNILNDTDWCV